MSRRNRKARGIIQSESKSLRTRSDNVQGQEKTDVLGQAKRAVSPVLWSSVLFRPLTDWTMPRHIGEGDLLYSIYRFKC